MAHLHSILGFHSRRRGHLSEPHGERLWQARHEQVRIPAADVQSTIKPILRDSYSQTNGKPQSFTDESTLGRDRRWSAGYGPQLGLGLDSPKR